MFTPVKIVRFWLPALIFVVGAGMVVLRPNIVGVEGAALMLGGGLGIVVSNRIHRMGLAGERDRDAEIDARAFLDRYGVWPDEAPPEVLDQAERDGLLPASYAPSDAAPEATDDDPTRAEDPGAVHATDAPAHPHAAQRRTGSGRSRRPG